MAGIELPNVEEAAQLALSWLEGSDGGETWVIDGDPTAGKTATLERLFEQVESESSLVPILVAPPPGAPDSGQIALLQIAERLSETGHGGAIEDLLDPTQVWAVKRERVRGWLRDASGEVLLLCDEPLMWPGGIEAPFGRHARNVWSMAFNGVGCRAVSAGDVPEWVHVVDRHWLEPASVGHAVVESLASTELADAAGVLGAIFGEQLGGFSPLQIRLLAALVAIQPTVALRVSDASEVDTTQIVAWLVEGVERNEELAALRLAWSRLAELREPFDRELLDLVLPSELTHLQRAILERCLLFERGDRFVLHESLRSQFDNDPEAQDPSLHEALAEYYRSRFLQKPDGELRLRDSMEAFHHSSIAGIRDSDRFAPFFLDQWSILGYYLSYLRKDYRGAAGAFEEALRWDPSDAYANHYLAFNLDILAEDIHQAEACYRRAIESDRNNVWYHSRLISFLLSLSRVDDARTAWTRAVNDLVTPDAEWDRELYFGLHLHIARMLVYRGELDFARSVLLRVPAGLRSEPVFENIKLRLDALREARDFGSFQPGWLLKPEWWLGEPNLLRRMWAGRPLEEWLAGEVEEVDDALVGLHVAYATDLVQREGEAPRPRTGHLEYTAEEIRTFTGQQVDVAVGDFVEIGVYGDVNPDVVIEVHSDRQWADLAYPGDVPHPDRYALEI